ncbi:MAG: MBL fold metallo-hydrolase [Chromatiales bacterium]|jgi:cyclase|nr:MBL fold metallo-hydrolase [Chromatiales bacterium]
MKPKVLFAKCARYTAFASVAILLGISSAAAQRDFSKVVIKPEQLSPGLHVMFGAGGNIGMLSGDDSVFLIDDQFAPFTSKILAAVKSISDKPIRFLLNTHWHFDHTGGTRTLRNEPT